MALGEKVRINVSNKVSSFITQDDNLLLKYMKFIYF